MVLRWQVSLLDSQDKETSQLYFISSTKSHLERQPDAPVQPPPHVPLASESGDAWLGRHSVALHPEAM